MKRVIEVGGHSLPAERWYEESTHAWVELREDGRARFGLDPLGAETSGDVVAISLVAVGTRVERGEPYGSLEAAKFVGPLLAPLSGMVAAANEDAIRGPGLVNRDPLGAWLVEVEPAFAPAELPLLLHGEERVRAWFEREIERATRKGMVAR